MVIDWALQHWNPILTLTATGLSFSLLCFKIYTYLNERGKLKIISIEDGEFNGDEFNFKLNAKNTGNEDIYIRNVYVDFNGVKSNTQNFDGDLLYMDEELRLEENQPIHHLHFTDGREDIEFDGDESTVEARVIVETNRRNIEKTASFSVV